MLGEPTCSARGTARASSSATRVLRRREDRRSPRRPPRISSRWGHARGWAGCCRPRCGAPSQPGLGPGKKWHGGRQGDRAEDRVRRALHYLQRRLPAHLSSRPRPSSKSMRTRVTIALTGVLALAIMRAGAFIALATGATLLTWVPIPALPWFTWGVGFSCSSRRCSSSVAGASTSARSMRCATAPSTWTC